MKFFKKNMALCAALLTLLAFGISKAAGQANPEASGAPPAMQAAAKARGYTPDPADFAVDRATGTEYVKRIVIVYFDKTASAKQRKDAREAVGGRVVGSVDVLCKWELAVPAETLAALRQCCELLRGMPGVVYASYDRVSRVVPQVWPDDPFSPTEVLDKENRWWAEAVRLPEAWELYEKAGPKDTLRAKVSLGVIDGGVAPHPDLEGLVDQLVPVNAARGLVHGTGVAGLMAARANNGIGIAGVCRNAQIYAVDFHTAGGSTSQIMNSVARVVQSGARAVNISLGWIGSNRFPNGITEQAHQDDEAAIAAITIDRLLENGYDFLVAQSAGNRPVDAIRNGMFCSVTLSPNNTGLSDERARDIANRILVVGASRRGGGITVYSARGGQVSLYAPGGEQGSPERQIFTLSGDAGYQYTQGTSFAAPLVAATAGWMLAANPHMNAGQAGVLLKQASVSPVVNNVKTLDCKRALDAAIQWPEN